MRLLSAAAVPVLLFLALAAWGFSSPVGSSPDDDFHLPSIYCGLGEREGLCEATGDPATRLVPAALVGEACYTRDASASAACWQDEPGAMAETDRVNVGPLYPPLFYGTMSVFAGPDVAASVIAMRLFNAALVVGVLTCVVLAAPARIRPAVVIGALASAVPLGLFIIPSTNASSWAFLSAATVWVSLYGATQTTGRRRVVLCGLALLGGIIGAGARADAAAFAVFGVVIAAILGARTRRSLWPVAATAAAIILVSALFYLGAGQGGSVTGGLPTDEQPLTGDQLVMNLLDVPSLWVGVFGYWGLGWLDTPLPDAVWVLGFGVFSGVVFTGLREMSLRKALALGAAFSALWVVPFVLLAQSDAIVGTYVQPRYILPLIVIAAGVAALGAGGGERWTGTWSLVGGVLLTATAAVALHVNLRRYITGLDDLALDPGARAEWWWTGTPAPLVVWVLGSASLAVAFALLEHLRRGVQAAPAVSIAQGSVSDPGVDSPRLGDSSGDRTATS